MTKVELYRELIKGQQDHAGFIESHECDSLLFSGLVGCVPGVTVHIDQAMGEPGQWFRRPIYDANGELDMSQECYSCGGSASSISRDMLLGLAWYAYYNKRLDISEGVIKYALKHFMVMGKGAISRILIMPALLATFAWISYRLGGPSRLWLRWIPADTGAKVDDYQAHLQVLHILLRKKLTGKWSKRDQKTVSRLQEDQPMNPLFLAASLEKDSSIELKNEILDLLDCEQWWPKDRLPTRADRKTQWLVQRSYGKDWEPADGDPQTHSGGDYLFVLWLVSLVS